MSFLTEATSEHFTVSDLIRRFGVSTDFPYGKDITVTSLSDSLEKVSPGTLYLGTDQGPLEQIKEAESKGAYSILFPTSVKEKLQQASASSSSSSSVSTIPLLFGDLGPAQLGYLAFLLAGRPTDTLATFAVVGQKASYAADSLAQLLHLLGNPIGVIDSRKSFSLERELDCTYPLGPLETQMILSQMLEDGVNTVILTINSSTFNPGALSHVGIDVCGHTQSFIASDLQPHTTQTERTAQTDQINSSDLTSDPSSGKRDGKMGEEKAGGDSGRDHSAEFAEAEDNHQPSRPQERHWSRWIPNYHKGEGHSSRHDLTSRLRQELASFGARIDDDTHCVLPTDASRQVARSVLDSIPADQEYEVYLSAAMAMSAGVRKNNVRSALLLAQEINKRQENN